MVEEDKKPTDHDEGVRCDAERLTNSAVVQVYDVVIEEGLPYGILVNGLAQVLLHMPYGDLATLLYHFCDPGREVDEQDLHDLQEQKNIGS